MASATIGSLRVNLAIDTAAFDKGISDFSSRMKSVGTKLAKVGAGMSAAITLPAIGFATKSVEAFQQSEDALRQVEAAIKSTGGTVGFTTEQLSEMAAGLQAVSTFDDDDIMQNVTAQLLKFGSVSGSVFQDAQQAILDFSARTSTSLEASTQLIGKALESPAKAIGALRKAGVTFTEDQQNLIKSLADTGRAAEAQGIILDALADKFGGAAAAMTDTTSGSQAQAWNAIGDAMEAVGEVVARVIPPIAAAIQRAAEWFTSLNPQVQEFVIIGSGIAAALGPALTAIGLMATGIAAIGFPIVGVITGIGLLGAAVVKFAPEIQAAADAVDAFLDRVRETAIARLQAFGQAFVGMKDVALQAVSELVTGIQSWLVDKMNAIIETAMIPIRKFQDAWAKVADVLVGHSIVPDIVTDIEGWMGRLGNTFGTSIAGLIEGTMSWKDALTSLLKEVANLALSKIGGSGGGGFFGSLMQGVLGNLPGFAEGGTFKVGGSGGIDSQLIGMRMSPGELLEVHKPGNDNGGGITVNNTVVNHAPGLEIEQRETGRSGSHVDIETVIRQVEKRVGTTYGLRRQVGRR